MKSEYEINGYHLVEGALGEDEVDLLIQELSVFENEMNNYGVRDLMNKVPAIRKLALIPTHINSQGRTWSVIKTCAISLL